MSRNTRACRRPGSSDPAPRMDPMTPNAGTRPGFPVPDAVPRHQGPGDPRRGPAAADHRRTRRRHGRPPLRGLPDPAHARGPLAAGARRRRPGPARPGPRRPGARGFAEPAVGGPARTDPAGQHPDHERLRGGLGPGGVRDAGDRGSAAQRRRGGAAPRVAASDQRRRAGHRDPVRLPGTGVAGPGPGHPVPGRGGRGPAPRLCRQP